jgi:hypothetical protein
MKRRRPKSHSPAPGAREPARRAAARTSVPDVRRPMRRSIGPSSRPGKRAEPAAEKLLENPPSSVGGGSGNGEIAIDLAWPFIPALDTFAGSARDLVASEVARLAFFEQFRTHPRVQESFEAWMHQLALIEPMETCAWLLDHEASILGVEDRSVISSVRMHGDNETRAELDRLVELTKRFSSDAAELERVDEALREAIDCLRERVSDGISVIWTGARSLIRELVKPGWPWLVSDLFFTFYGSIMAAIAGGGIVATRKLQVQTPCPSDVTMAFLPEPGEPAEQAFARYEALDESIRARFAEVLGGERTELTPAEERRTARAARNFYGQRVLGKSVRTLAREYCASDCSPRSMREDHDHRATIRDDIDLAERLLSLGHAWEALGEPITS